MTDINSTDRSKELAIVTVVVLLMFRRVDGHAHPGMDTALKFGGLSLRHQGASCAGVSIEKDIVWARRLWDELSIYNLRALGSRDRIARCGIQRSDKPAAEFLHASKRVRFASEILKHEAEALFGRGSIGNETPRADGFVGTEFRLKTREGDYSGRNSCRGSDAADRGKSDGIAIVADMDVQHARLIVFVRLSYWSNAKKKPSQQ